MKINHMLMRRVFIAAICVMTFGLLHAANPTCGVIRSLESLSQRLDQAAAGAGVKLGNKIDGLVNSDRIKSHPRFQNQNGLSPEAQALAEINFSLGAAEDVAPNMVGEKTANAWVEIEASDSVVDAVNVSYLDQGTGLGYIVRDSGLDDDLVEELLKRLHADLPETPTLKSMNVTVAHVADSVRVLRKANVDLPAKYWGTGGLRSMEKGTSSGTVAEVVIMAKAARGGKRISGVDKDTTDPEYADTKIDYFENDDVMCQVGSSLDAVIAKWDKLSGDQERAAFQAALAKARFLEPNRTYVYKYLDPAGQVPPQAKIEKLNALISNPEHWFTSANFVPVTSLP